MAYRNFEIKPGTEVRKKKSKRIFYNFKDLILYEDDSVIVVNKPKGVSSLDDREEGRENLLQWGRNYFPDLKICHRLDKSTTGVIIFAKNPDVYREISMQFEHRQVAKHYLALVSGVRTFEEFEIDEPIYQTGSGVSRVNRGQGKSAITLVNTLETYREHSLVECFPMTGRTHQIRVHMAFVGCPLVGDHKYKGKDLFLSRYKKDYRTGKGKEELPVNKEFLLHARGLSLTLPGKEELSTFLAPLPKNFEVVLKILRKYGVK